MDFSANFPAMTSAAEQVSSASTNLLTTVENLSTTIAAAAAEFEGATSEAFGAAQLTYNNAHAQVSSDVQSASMALQRIIEEYMANEARYAGAWAG